MLMKTKRMSFLDSFLCRWSPKWVFSSLVRSVKVGFIELKVLMDPMARLHCPLVQLGPVFLELLPIVFPGLVGFPYFCVGGGQVLVCCHHSKVI